MADDQPPAFDPSGFNPEPYVRRVEKPWGYELLFLPTESPYLCKIMHIKAGARQSLQIHDTKIETYVMRSGRAKLQTQNSKGETVEVEIPFDKGITTQVGQKHRIIAITDCDVFEASTPERGTTWRLEDDYARDDEAFGTKGRTADHKDN